MENGSAGWTAHEGCAADLERCAGHLPARTGRNVYDAQGRHKTA